MNTREVTVVAVVLLCVGGVALPTVAAATETPNDEPNATSDGTNATANETGNESDGFGMQLTAFMQSSAAETNDTVESGMWKAAFERANESRRARLAHDRTGTLERRLERLQERNRTLTERYENGSISREAYVAQASALSGRIAALQSSVDDAERVAGDSGVNVTRLNELRENARNATGPKVPGVARGVVAGGQGVAAGKGNGPGDTAAAGSVGPEDGTRGESSNATSKNASEGENANPRNGGGNAGSNESDAGANDASTGETSSGDGDQGNGNGGSGNGNGPDDARDAGPRDYLGLFAFDVFR